MVTYTGQCPALPRRLRFRRRPIRRAPRSSPPAAGSPAPPRTLMRRGHERRRGHVGHAQQIEARQQAAEHRAHGVSAVEQAHPRNALGRGLDPARRRRQRRAHQEWSAASGRSRTPARAAEWPASRAPPPPCTRHPPAACRTAPECRTRDAEFHFGIHPQRMLLARPLQARQQEAAQAQPAHEGGQQHAERNGARPDHQLQQLVPHDLINQRRASAARKQKQQQGKIAARSSRREPAPGIRARAARASRVLRVRAGPSRARIPARSGQIPPVESYDLVSLRNGRFYNKARVPRRMLPEGAGFSIRS